VQFRLLRYKMLLSNIKLFLIRVTRQLNDFHSVKQGSGDSRSIVRRCDKHNLAQVKFKLDIAVNKRAVLFAVKSFKQCRRRVALVVRAELVDFVKQNDRILSSCLLNCIYNPARHCADIGFSVASNFSLIACAAERNSRKASAHRRCNAFGNRGFTDTRRTYKAKRLTVTAVRKRTYGKSFDNSFLDLVEAVMIAVEHLSRMSKVKLVR